MKIIKSIVLGLMVINTSASYLKSVGVGVGTFTEQVNKIQEEITGESNTFEFNPYAKLTMRADFYFGHQLDYEVGISTPRESRDSDVTRFNYWINFLPSYDTGYVWFNRFYYGLGFYYTRLSMDGSPQQLSNAGEGTTFQTPSGSSTATNITFVLGMDLINIDNHKINIQTSVLNLEDSKERAFNSYLSYVFEFSDKQLRNIFK